MEKLIGSNAQAVIELIRERRGITGQPKALSTRKLGLVVEGGGMRGVLSAGSLLALDLMGMRDCFDSVYAVSAGAVNAAYFLSGQGALGISVYFDNICSRRFINPWRVWKIVDVDFVYDIVVPQLKPLNEDVIRNGKQEFYVTVTDVDTGKNVLLNAKDRAASVPRYLKASSALPVLYNRSVEIASHRYMDGGVSGGLPLDWAVAQGCTDILVLLSRPAQYVTHTPNSFEKLVFRTLTGWKHPEVFRAFMGSFSQKEYNRRLATGEERIDGLNIATVPTEPAEDGVERVTIDRRKLLRGAYQSAATAFEIFDEDKASLDRAFVEYKSKKC